MNIVWDMLQNVDLTMTGQELLTLMNTADPIFPAILLGLLTLLGAKMAGPYPNLRSWGLRAGVATFLITFACTWFAQGGNDPQELPRIGLRAAVAAGLVLAPLWLLLPILFFVYGRLRLVLAAFLLYVGYAGLTAGSLDMENFPAIALRGGIAAGVTLLVAWIVQPLTDFLAKNLFPKPKPPTPAPPPVPALPLHYEAEQTWRLRETAAEVLNLQKAQLRQEAEWQAEEHRRRQRARLKAELCYTLNEPALAKVLPRAVFEDFLARYLGDQHAPEAVEENAHELEAMIVQHVQHSHATPVQSADLLELTPWSLDEKPRLPNGPSDRDRRKTQLAGLNRKPTQLAESLVEEEVG